MTALLNKAVVTCGLKLLTTVQNKNLIKKGMPHTVPISFA